MIQAKIPQNVAAPSPERSGRSTRPLPGRPDDRDYYRRRLAQEYAAARAATTLEARSAHEQLAQAYRRLSIAD